MSDNDIENLELCPFCGSNNTDPAFARGFAGGDETKPEIAAGCFNCGCTGPSVLVPSGSNGYAQSAAAWNRRTIERLKERSLK